MRVCAMAYRLRGECVRIDWMKTALLLWAGAMLGACGGGGVGVGSGQGPDPVVPDVAIAYVVRAAAADVS